MQVQRSGRHVQTLNIPDDGQTSEAINIPAGMRPVALQLPSQIDATAITFTGSPDGTTYTAITDPAGTALSVTVAASKYVMLPDLSGVPFLKIVLGTQQTTGDDGVDIGIVFEAIGPAGYWHSGAILAAT